MNFHKTVLVSSFLLLSLIPLNGFAAKDLGVGFILGEPTGLSAKLWTGKKSAFDLAVAWAFTNKGFLGVHADYLIHDASLLHLKRRPLYLHFGIGGRVRLGNNEVRVGARIPVGLAYYFRDPKVELFFEIAAVVDFTPATTASPHGGLGVRFYL